MFQGYPFWVDAAGACSIYDPILRATVTTLTFRGASRLQKLMGVSVACGTETFLNNIRILVGNGLPAYRYFEIDPSGFLHDVAAQSGSNMLNYRDLGGQPIMEGETITITAVGTGTFAGTLWVEDMEPPGPKIPNGNVVMLKCGGTNDVTGGTITSTGFDMDARSLENNRLYSVFAVDVLTEDEEIEALLMAAGKDVMTFPPIGRMVYPTSPLQFTGTQYNAGHVIGYCQTAAAGKIDVRIWMIESPVSGGQQPVNATPVNNVTSINIPGVVSIAPLVGGQILQGGGSLRGQGNTFSFQRR